ncbi:M24 family metallopeptidase [Woeseia oceani]|uniref:Peptidase n=1 Tax=Woeseia oceani TaxID=1548547 RepID=A0A193LJC1_9GAMM|nr:Xaa-Pro peptidase family protein [Woeseia oceani]ANO52494.1 peptidase [Woeseia oceani]
MNKRQFLKMAAAGSLGATLPMSAATAAADETLPNITGHALAITSSERQARVAKAQRLMRAAGIDALLLEAGSALIYFTGIHWWRSERFTGAIIPADGEIAVVTPYFEEPSIRENLSFGDDVRTWHEHEDPFALVAGILRDRGLRRGKIAIEETVRYFIAHGVQQAAADFSVVSGASITRGCRMFKSPAEIALMQLANDVTLAAYRHVHRNIEAGMTAQQVSLMMSDATRALGGSPQFSSVLLNEASAYPHGTNQPQTVNEGGIVLMDCGCSVHDYESDISRTFVYGEPTAKQRKVWNTVKQGQQLALETARIGTPAGKVDDVVRDYYEKQGYGPGYKTPGLSHRLGHGIGIDGHEPVNFVHGEATPLAPGMCFSNEPGIYLFGEFGVRLEDCLYMSDAGPTLFTALSPSIDQPFGD